MPRFWNWITASADTENRAVLVIDNVIDSGTGWYDDAVTPRAFREELDAHAGEAIQVEINSPGGDVFAGFEIYNMLQGHKGGVRVRVVGHAASAASMIAMAADPGELTMCELSAMMIHEPATCAWGNRAVLRDQADVLELILDVMVQCYMHRFKGGEDELRAMLAQETWLTPARALEIGLCDQIELPQGDGETGSVSAAMAGRYVALDARALRERLGIPCKAQKPAPKAADGNKAAQLLGEADALMASMIRLNNNH